MSPRLDHFVFVVKDLQRAASRFESMGFSVTEAGRHVSQGSANKLIGLPDATYLELFSFDRPEVAPNDHAMLPLFEVGQGLAIYWLCVPDLASEIARWSEVGVQYGMIQQFSRTKLDGSNVTFKISTPSCRASRCYPFLIEDVTGRVDRVPAANEQLNGAIGVSRIEVAVPDQKVVDHYHKYFGTKSSSSGSVTHFRIGDAAIVLRIDAAPPAVFAGLAGGEAWGPKCVIFSAGAGPFAVDAAMTKVAVA